MNPNKALHKESNKHIGDSEPAPEEHSEVEDAALRRLIQYYQAPPVPPGLEERIANALVDASEVQVKAAQAKIELRRTVVLSLVRVFGFSVFITVMILILVGLGVLKLPPEIIHVLLASTIAQVVVLYRRVIPDIFRQGAG